jgi:hypothetical protein
MEFKCAETARLLTCTTIFRLIQLKQLPAEQICGERTMDTSKK